MYSFYSIWVLLNPQGEYKRRKRVCERLWSGYDEATRRHIYQTIASAKEQGVRVHPNPYFAIEDVMVTGLKKVSKQSLSYAEYYKRFGTTEEQGGWKMANPTGNKIIYVKGGGA